MLSNGRSPDPEHAGGPAWGGVRGRRRKEVVMSMIIRLIRKKVSFSLLKGFAPSISDTGSIHPYGDIVKSVLIDIGASNVDTGG